jgi:hypothetical protein
MTEVQSALRMDDRHSFPVGGLVELSRATYQSTPLAVVKLRPTVFSFMTNGSYPVIDESSCGSLHGMIQAIERLLPIINAETTVVPGHGPIANRDDLVNFYDTLRTIEGRVQRLIAAGSSVAEILAAAPSAEFDPVWGRGYVTGTVFVRMILAGLGLTEKPDRNYNG